MDQETSDLAVSKDILLSHVRDRLVTLTPQQVRVLMIIDAPDDLEQLMSPPGLKQAMKYADSVYAKAKTVQVVSEAGTDLRWQCGEYPVMTQWGYADEPGHFDHWGGGHIHTFPNEGSASGKVVIQPGDIIILPYCRYVTDAVQLEVREGHITQIDGGLDAKLMRDWLNDGKEHENDRDPFALSHLGWGMNPQARWYWMGLNGSESERNRAAARVFPGNFLFSSGPNTQGGGKRGCDHQTHNHLPFGMGLRQARRGKEASVGGVGCGVGDERSVRRRSARRTPALVFLSTCL